VSASSLFFWGTLIAAGAADISSAAEPPPSSGEQLVQQYCANCHPIETVLAKKHSKDEWTEIIFRMVDHGLNAPPEDLEAILVYLSNAKSAPPSKGR